MFTGIVTAVGEIRAVEGGRYRIACPYAPGSIALGASIACDGCCLTVTQVEPDEAGALFAVELSQETLRRTALGDWRPGTAVNLERSLALGDEMGGHIVTGHIDGVAEIVAMAAEGWSQRVEIACEPRLSRFIASKGSVALDGVSLTVNEAGNARFTVNLIPHTLSATTWRHKRAGSRLNLEVDLIARYVARLIDAGPENTA